MGILKWLALASASAWWISAIIRPQTSMWRWSRLEALALLYTFYVKKKGEIDQANWKRAKPKICEAKASHFKNALRLDGMTMHSQLFDMSATAVQEFSFYLIVLP